MKPAAAAKPGKAAAPKASSQSKEDMMQLAQAAVARSKVLKLGGYDPSEWKNPVECPVQSAGYHYASPVLGSKTFAASALVQNQGRNV